MANLISTGIGGAPVSELFIGDRHYDITVRFPADDRDSPEAIKNLVLTSSDGALIPLSQVADVKLQTGESMINREMDHRYLLVKLDTIATRFPWWRKWIRRSRNGCHSSAANFTSNGAGSSTGRSWPRSAI